MSRREEMEREVLATLLLEPSSFNELPEGFHGDAFEFREYRKLFESIYSERKKLGTQLLADFIKLLPDQRKVIDDVTFAAMPLNGKLRSRATVLMLHRPEPEEPKSYSQYFVNEAKSPKRFEFELWNGKEICSMDIPPKSWLIQDLITEKSVNFLAGEEGCGKSLVAMNLALSVTIGAESWLSYRVSKQGKVLYLNNELAFDDYARRLKSMAKSPQARGDISNLIVPKRVLPIRECWDALRSLCMELKPCLVVVDCLYFSHDEDENDSSAMKALMRKFIELRDEFGLAVLLVHHTKKGTRYNTMHNDNMRGSSVFGGSADMTLEMRRSTTEEGKRIIKSLKGRHVSDAARKCHLLSLNPATLWFSDEGETEEGDHITSAPQTAESEVDFSAIFAESKELTRKEIQERCRPLGYDERTIDRLIKRKLRKGSKYGHYTL